MPKKRVCQVCKSPLRATDSVYCSKRCEDEGLATVSICRVKAPVMSEMRFMAQGDGHREIRFLSGLISCLKADLEERLDKLPNAGDICTCDAGKREYVSRIHDGSFEQEILKYCIECGGLIESG